MTVLKGRRIVLGVSGGIAAYKAAELVRLLVKAGADVHVVLSEGGARFVTAVTFQALSGNTVWTDLWDARMPNNMAHIDLGRDADAILVAPATADFIARVAASIVRLLPDMPRRDTIATSLKNRGALIHVRDLAEACDIANRIAPEHLELSLAEPGAWVERIRHAGAIFIGHHSVEALGDYCAGPNHVLPTMRSARFSSPLGVYDFQKRTSLIEVSEAGAQTLGRIASVLARGEGLQAHARSAEMRLKD